MRTRLIASLALALALAIPASALAGLYMEDPSKSSDGKRKRHPESSYHMSASSHGYNGGFPIDRPDNKPNPYRTHQPKPAPPWERPKLF